MALIVFDCTIEVRSLDFVWAEGGGTSGLKVNHTIIHVIKQFEWDYRMKKVVTGVLAAFTHG